MLNLLKIIKIQKEIVTNVAHPNGEEHSRVPKGNGVKHLTETPFEERMGNFGICLACAVAVIYLVGNDVTGAGVG